jgi:hypothetical protein
MGTIINIAIHTEQEQAGKVYKALLKRLLERGEIKKSTVEGWIHKNFVKHKPKGGRTSGDMTYIKDDILPIGDDILPNGEAFDHLINSIPYSNKIVQIRLLYRLFSEEEIGLSIYLNGKDYESGFTVRYNSYIVVSISKNDVNRPIKNISYDPYYKALTQEQLLADDTFQQLATQVAHDWAHLFLHVCGMDSVEEPLVQHAAMYMESGWPSPACCAMLYHRDKREFAKDFLRLYRDYNLENQSALQMLDMDFNVEQDLESNLISTDKKVNNENSFYYKQFDFEEEKLIDFLSELELRKVVKLSRFTESEISAALSLAGEWAEEHEFDYSTIYLDFKENGGAILSTPTTSIWRVYEYIYQLV